MSGEAESAGLALADVFAEDGPLANALAAYRPRAGQFELAAAIDECLGSGTDLVAEAATGTGKTLAYLVPVLLRGERTIISTGTLNLQDQLYARDLPLALRALGLERKVALLKGRSNYLCLHRLDKHGNDPEVAEGAVGEELQMVRRWARHTVSGEISELDDIPTRSPVWPLVTSTQDNCLGGECEQLADCHLLRARRQAQEADIVVVNHHLLFADMALKQTGFGEVLPGAGAVVIDEAHQVPETAMRFFSRGVSAWQLRELGADTLRAAGQASGALKLLMAPVQNLRTALDQAVSECLTLPQRGEFSALTACLPHFASLRRALQALVAALEPLAEQSRDLGNAAQRAAVLEEGLGDFLAGREGYVRWFANRRGRFALNLTPLDVAGPLRQLRERVPATWIMTSATLAVAGRFDHFTRRLGLDDARERVIESPFDYPEQTRLWLPEGLPDPGSRDHVDQLLSQVLPVLRAAGGRAFLLFTSHRALRRAADWLRAHSDFQLLVQEDAPRPVLLRRFRESPGSLLLGAASFWEGVDVPGRELSVVVIDKLPFAAPDDPVLEATLKAVRESGGNPFAEVQLPQAVLALKQGAGRLIRQADDFGVLVLGDPRLVTRPYGKLFLRSLPPMTPVQSGAEAARFIKDRLST
ncbi:ATP-dependent DNA helicase [Wenzhouxiangella sp. AB-CW3]|uniref:ATP-dependent DNA helicase n=1 Tax=Wenzhouxiangella sp. AB-CW3 TaxID=2771012 RepID=UPI00168AFE75|nr:ATP-dependent DNA helicase [Wenzhouxiangella sp. AB-CW3]QOC21891.1 ATP-dependent DNA helicase [Wenzhouxiangella sp. AB-CW3]